MNETTNVTITLDELMTYVIDQYRLYQLLDILFDEADLGYRENLCYDDDKVSLVLSLIAPERYSLRLQELKEKKKV